VRALVVRQDSAPQDFHSPLFLASQVTLLEACVVELAHVGDADLRDRSIAENGKNAEADNFGAFTPAADTLRAREATAGAAAT